MKCIKDNSGCKKCCWEGAKISLSHDASNNKHESIWPVVKWPNKIYIWQFCNGRNTMAKSIINHSLHLIIDDLRPMICAVIPLGVGGGSNYLPYLWRASYGQGWKFHRMISNTLYNAEHRELETDDSYFLGKPLLSQTYLGYTGTKTRRNAGPWIFRFY